MKNNLIQIEDAPVFETHKGHLTLKQVYEGIHVFGGTGSGKTSSMKFFALKMLKLGMGGIVLCDKPDEAKNWQTYAEETNRTKDFLFLSEEYFNFLDYEATRKGGGYTENITNIFMEVLAGHKMHEDFWLKATHQLIRNCIDLLIQSREKLNLKNMLKVVSQSPRNDNDLLKIKESWFGGLIAKAEQYDHYDFEIMSHYWLYDFVQLANETRTSIIQTFSAIADKLARGRIGQVFNTKTTFNFDDLRNGKVLVCDISNKEHGEIGKFSNILIKYMFQKMTERRHDTLTPAFIWADEAQFFISKNDTNFLQTARSSKVVNVYLTQNINNYFAELGGSGQAKSLVNSLLGNFQTKIFCQNTDLETNQYAADLLGKKLWDRYSHTVNEVHVETVSAKSQTRDFLIQPSKFDQLEKGGSAFDYRVGIVLYNPSIPSRYIYTLINQKTGKTKTSIQKLEEEGEKPETGWRGCIIFFVVLFLILAYLFWHLGLLPV